MATDPAPATNAQRFTEAHAAILRIPKVVERFWRQVNKTSNCWLWTGSTSGRLGYGRFCFGKTRAPAHCVAYFLLVGNIPKGMQPDHKCRVPQCVNPDHIDIVTPRENTMRGVGPTAKNARKVTCKRGHLLIGSNLQIQKTMTRTWRRCKQCVRDYQPTRRLRARRKRANAR